MERAKLDRAIAELEEIKKLPKEAQKKYIHTLDEDSYESGPESSEAATEIDAEREPRIYREHVTVRKERIHILRILTD